MHSQGSSKAHRWCRVTDSPVRIRSRTKIDTINTCYEVLAFFTHNRWIHPCANLDGRLLEFFITLLEICEYWRTTLPQFLWQISLDSQVSTARSKTFIYNFIIAPTYKPCISGTVSTSCALPLFSSAAVSLRDTVLRQDVISTQATTTDRRSKTTSAQVGRLEPVSETCRCDGEDCCIACCTASGHQRCASLLHAGSPARTPTTAL